MKAILAIPILAFGLLAGGCGTPNMERYADTQPELDLLAFFDGRVVAWCMVQDRSGEVTRRFKADFTAKRSGDSVAVHERAVYVDGEIEVRDWIFTRTGEHRFTGKSADLVGEAIGTTYGHALNWKYIFKVQSEGKTWELDFDDSMYRIDDSVVLNRVIMRKFGVRVGELTVAFQRAN